MKRRTLEVEVVVEVTLVDDWTLVGDEWAFADSAEGLSTEGASTDSAVASGVGGAVNSAVTSIV